MKNNLIDSDNNMYLTVDSLIDINNIITGLNNIILRKGNVKPHECDKIYMDKDLIEDKLYQLIDRFNEIKIILRDSFFFFFHYSAIYNHFMMKMKELVRYFIYSYCRDF